MTTTDGFQAYRYHMRQPALHVRDAFELTGSPELAHIDLWLSDYFRITGLNLPSAGSGEDAARANAIAITARALTLYGELARASGLPSFDPGRVLRVAIGDAGRVDITVALPIVENLHDAIFARLFHDALQLVLGPLSLAPSPETASTLLLRIENELASKLRETTDLTSTTVTLSDFAYRSGVPFRHLGGGTMLYGWGARAQIMHSSTGLADSVVGNRISGNKFEAARFMRAAGLPVPEHMLVQTREQALRAAETIGWPVVVKPIDRERSEGVTAFIDNEADFLAAFDYAREWGEAALVEKHIHGASYRILVANGQVNYVVERIPKCVIGNGQDTVAQLAARGDAAREKLPPWKRLMPFPIDDLARQCLARDGLTPDSVPAEGQRAWLRPIFSNAWGGDVAEVTDQLHPENVQLACEVTRLFGLSIAGVDMITPDLTRPWYENGAVINEINTRPQINSSLREHRLMQFWPLMLGGDGRIPVHLIVGTGDLVGAARDRRNDLGASRHYLTTADRTERPDGLPLVLGADTLFDRAIALILRRDVRALVLAGSLDEIVRRGLPVDGIDSLRTVGLDGAEADDAQRRIRALIPVVEREPAEA
ncbi:ATP-grasp domain-containing protein [Novosphingobium album (ex Liu et al. 2023)]|uniref:ATP-grasp domain-containing protein n=1 Tax=Novosphingobium album (ex Liu et al. 2023) TaxID=3031130 RepID=A0ABT5WQA8_9SPHN|nr:ATP-grasp domain-containing protein [Novosphingobium album (ex Liu et al. 2023)]MDE8652064.1 ATP-grasp domain-containing protein [Novosphingobium album (ex Liu et al. 2023)]